MQYGKTMLLLAAIVLGGTACTYIPPTDEEPPVLPAQSADPLDCKNTATCTVPEAHEILKSGPNPTADYYDDADDSAPAKVPPGLQKSAAN